MRPSPYVRGPCPWTSGPGFVLFPCKDLSFEEDSSPSFNNLKIWTLRRSLLISLPVDVATVNGKHNHGKDASRSGTGGCLNTLG